MDTFNSQVDSSGGFKSPWTVGRLMWDTNCFIDFSKDDKALRGLFELRERFLIEIVKSDVVDSEVSEMYHRRFGDEFDITQSFVELMGPLCLNESRLSHGVLGTVEELRVLRRISAILKPGVRSVQGNDLRDAMHLVTAVKYGCNVFVTRDINILRHASELRDEWNFKIVSPEDALDHIIKLIMRRMVSFPETASEVRDDVTD